MILDEYQIICDIKIDRMEINIDCLMELCRIADSFVLFYKQSEIKQNS